MTLMCVKSNLDKPCLIASCNFTLLKICFQFKLTTDCWVRVEGHFLCPPPLLPPPPLIRTAGPCLVGLQIKAKQSQANTGMDADLSSLEQTQQSLTYQRGQSNVYLMLSESLHVYANIDQFNFTFFNIYFILLFSLRW